MFLCTSALEGSKQRAKRSFTAHDYRPATKTRAIRTSSSPSFRHFSPGFKYRSILDFIGYIQGNIVHLYDLDLLFCDILERSYYGFSLSFFHYQQAIHWFTGFSAIFLPWPPTITLSRVFTEKLLYFNGYLWFCYYFFVFDYIYNVFMDVYHVYSQFMYLSTLKCINIGFIFPNHVL